eukprot:1850555-Prymnesium_polylepis.1
MSLLVSAWFLGSSHSNAASKMEVGQPLVLEGAGRGHLRSDAAAVELRSNLLARPCQPYTLGLSD